MEKTRFAEIISVLTEEDFKELGDFVSSPVFNKNKQVTKLYEFLFSEAQESGSPDIPKEEMWRYVYGVEEYNDDKYLKLTSDFVKLAEKYFVYRKNDADEIRKKILLLETFRETGLEKNFSKYYKELERYNKKEFNRTAEYYLKRYEFECEALLFNRLRKDFDLSKALSELDSVIENAFLMLKLDNLIHSILSEGEEGRTKEVLEIIEKNLEYYMKESPLIYGRYLVVKMLEKAGGEKYFRELKEFLSEYSKKLEKVQVNFFYDKLLLYCETPGRGRETPDGADEIQTDNFGQEEFLIHKAMDEAGILLDNGVFTGYNHFLKVANCALSLGELDWAENFIEKYGNKILPEFREDTVRLAKADVFIFLKKFDSALQELSLVNNHNYYFYLARNLKTIIIYYEQEDMDSVTYAIDAVKHYLSRNRDKVGDLYDYYNNFLNFTSRLARNTSRRSMHVIKSDIENTHEVANRGWLGKR